MKNMLYEFVARGRIERYDHHERLSSLHFEIVGLIAIASVVIASAVSIALLKHLNKKRP